MSAATPKELLRIGLPAERTADPAWTLVEEGFDLPREHEIESLFAVGNGYFGTRGTLEEGAQPASPGTFLAGVFDPGGKPNEVPEYAVAPNWLHVRVIVGGEEARLESAPPLEHRRILDLRQGIGWREWRHRDGAGRVTAFRTLRLASLHARHAALQSVLVTPENYSGPIRIEAVLEPARPHVAGLATPRPVLTPAGGAAGDGEAPSEGRVLHFVAPGRGTRVCLACASRLTRAGNSSEPRYETIAGEGSIVFLERWDLEARIGEPIRLDRFFAFCTSRESPRPGEEAARRLSQLTGADAESVAAAHRDRWAERWRACDVQLEGDDLLQKALRFGAYHLVCAANPQDERVSIGARTLTGESYKGHVFWDTDVFMLPFFAFTEPAAARAQVMYRHHLLEPARRKARGLGYRGALFPWESADTGEETTPRYMLAPDGEVVRILSGDQEHHIAADVAYGAWTYWKASGDDGFLLDAGAELILETARFWSSRGAFEKDGRYHIREVIGPDEYHEGIDDSVFTNVMAQWNLERGLELAALCARRWPEVWTSLARRLDLTPEELAEWRRVAEGMYVGFDEATGVFEQFAGYFGLDEADLSPMHKLGKRAAALDVILGRDKTKRSKVVKQADVVMLIALLWDRFPAAVREANFRYYEPRTCHGSSLSPAVHAWVAARLGDHHTAAQYFRQAATIDLANNMGNAAGGVHAAALGGLWQAAVFGFAGMRASDGRLEFAPNLPPAWRAMRFPVQWRGARLDVEVAGRPASVKVRLHGGGPAARVGVEGGHDAELRGGSELLALRGEEGWLPWRQAPEGGGPESGAQP